MTSDFDYPEQEVTLFDFERGAKYDPTMSETDDNGNEVQATLRASESDIRSMIERSSLDGEKEHAELYLNILDDHVEILQSAPGETVITYSSFGETYFDELSCERETEQVTVGDGTGDEIEYETGTEAILDVSQTIEYLSYASTGGTVELTFSGSEKRRLSSMLRAEGALEAWVNLPGSESSIEHVPYGQPSRYTDEERFTSVSGNKAPTTVETDVSNIERIVDVVKADRDQDYYPIVVDDGAFRINVGESHSSGVRGELGSTSIDGPDIENFYSSGFEEVINVLSGSVELQTAPGNNPLSIVEEGGSGDVIRHVVGPVNV